jgi:mannose-1-phosphate guanylyltransferase
MVPVANRPIMEHILALLARHGLDRVIANLHWFPDTITDRFGDGSGIGIELTYSYEETLLGTAGGVRNVREYFGAEPFLVMAADALTDVDLAALAHAHRANDGIATLAVKRVQNVSEYGVIVTGSDGRIQGFQEKPDPAEALSDLANCMIYVLDPEVFDYFPEQQEVDFALDVFPALLEHDVPFFVHVTDAYWNDVGSLPEYLQGNLDVLAEVVAVEPAGELIEGDADQEAGDPGVNGRVLVAETAEIATGARIDGPAVIGPGARVGAGAMVKESVLLPGAEVPPETLLAGSIAGRRGALG